MAVHTTHVQKWKLARALLVSLPAILYPQPLSEPIFKPPVMVQAAANAQIHSQGLREVVGKSAVHFVSLWHNRPLVSKKIAEEAARIMHESTGRGYRLGEWDCALFTAEVYSRVLSSLMQSSLAEAGPASAYSVKVYFGKTTYEQWNSADVIIPKTPKPLLLAKLSDDNIGDLIFHQDVFGEVGNPTPAKRYGHVAIYTGSRNGIHYAIANTKRKNGSGVMELPLLKMFRAGKHDVGSQPLLFMSRPSFGKLDITEDGGAIVISTGGRHPIRIVVTRVH
ncbi:MAG: hypothetical protein N3G76_01650 [Candidatus Micrarchaeota archaeon]|nr:hypothetical protein [Candidatus Micrarchaeota archaeon]